MNWDTVEVALAGTKEDTASWITLNERESGRQLGNSQKMDNLHTDIREFVKEVLVPLLAAKVLRQLREKREDEKDKTG